MKAKVGWAAAYDAPYSMEARFDDSIISTNIKKALNSFKMFDFDGIIKIRLPDEAEFAFFDEEGNEVEFRYCYVYLQVDRNCHCFSFTNEYGEGAVESEEKPNGDI